MSPLLTELPVTTLNSFAGRFTEPPAGLAAASIAVGNTAGRLWAGSESASPPALVLWDQGNNILYVGSASGDGGAIRRLVDHEIRDAAIAAHLERFGVRALDTTTEQTLAASLSPLLIGERRMQFWRWPAGHEPAAHSISPAGVRLESIGHALLARDDIAGLDEVRQEVGWMWPSIERFEEQGLGVAALLEGRLICWCTAEYLSHGRCGIGIATHGDYRGLGVATATAAEFVREALRRGLTPCWECGTDNPASARVAAKLGFEMLVEHRTLLGRFE